MQHKKLPGHSYRLRLLAEVLQVASMRNGGLLLDGAASQGLLKLLFVGGNYTK
jgi:hypothetical protein